jgi:succinate dehydrogenase/fumarate reductase cytochrome b subunit
VAKFSGILMPPLFKIIAIGMFFAIVWSLGTALYHMASDKGDSTKMVKALAVRVGLSLTLFLLLMAAWWAGMISPTGLNR